MCGERAKKLELSTGERDTIYILEGITPVPNNRGKASQHRLELVLPEFLELQRPPDKRQRKKGRRC